MIFFTKQIGYTIFRASDFHFVYNILVLCIWSRAYSNLFPTKCLHLEYSDVLSCSYHTRCHVTTDKRQSTGPVSRKTVGGEKNIFFTDKLKFHIGKAPRQEEHTLRNGKTRPFSRELSIVTVYSAS